ncbi:MAG TPA: M48 family metallopeptidase [Xanthobacteraceae bacterium]|nr:M48 family metallopeptidase [Xanthobacteraceae bacterium]
MPEIAVGGATARPAIYFDGTSSRRHIVTLHFGSDLEIVEDGAATVSWRYDELRSADGGPDMLRLKCVSALPLARLEVFDPAAREQISAHARFLDVEHGTGHTGRIVAWSLAAAISIVAIVLFGLPLVAERLVPLIPLSFEQRLGGMADNQVRAIFGGKACTDEEGDAAFAKLVETLRRAGHLDMPLQTTILASPVPNAFALPGGRIYLLNGLLQKAESPDEIAGVIAHEMGHVSHRDQTRMMIQNGGTSFLVGLLFGDVTGSTAVIFTARSLLQASYSRDAEAHADAFAIDTMHALGRSPKPMGELLFRITGAESGHALGILASHPLTEERRELMRREDRPDTGPDILSASEWQALKNVCHATSVK